MEIYAVLAAETFVFVIYARLFPKIVSESIATSMFQTLIQIDGIMLGFVGAVFGLLAANKSNSSFEQRRMFGLASFTLLVYFSAISVSFWALANSANGISSYYFVLPLALTAAATTYFGGATYKGFAAKARE